MDRLISRKTTGTPQEFSKKMNLSKRGLLGYVQAMKLLGFPIKYDKERRTYFYSQPGEMNDHLFKPLSKYDQKQININLSQEDKERCASALLQNNSEKINSYCTDIFIE